MKNKKLFLIFAGIAGSILFLLILFLAFVGILLSGPGINKTSFDAAEWRRVGESDARQSMVDDFLDNHHPKGLNREEIIALLGERSKTHHFSKYDLVYWVGVERGYAGIDSEWLVIRFDEQGIVTEAKLLSD